MVTKMTLFMQAGDDILGSRAKFKKAAPRLRLGPIRRKSEGVRLA
jgi:hypothetical protein